MPKYICVRLTIRGFTSLQVRSAQPGPQQHPSPAGQGYNQQPIRSPAQVQYMPAQPKGPDFAYGPPQPGFSPMSHGGYPEQQPRRPEPAPNQAYQPAAPKKTYITDVPPSLAPFASGPAVPPKTHCSAAGQQDVGSCTSSVTVQAQSEGTGIIQLVHFHSLLL
ncbi:hypothetical protein WMY93_024613 [Mugilogobius chulae]|uniref:Uncharacterized protein n=1 Tax=Mugilogobius chulae TaxID=88201 RepID=A0AAW0N1S6_9GOBI